jgi:hypothetical protein
MIWHNIKVVRDIVPLLKESVSSLSRGRVPDSSPWIVFCLLFTTFVQFTEQPSVLPPALFRCSRTLSAHWCSTSSTPLRTPSAYWQSTPASIALVVKVSPGRACNDYNLTFCVDVKWQISQQTSLFPKLLLCHWQITPLSFWKHPVVIVVTFKVKVYLMVSRHFPAQPFHPVLVLAFAWQLFSSLHLRLPPFLGSSIVLQFQYWSSKFWKSTVLDSAKLFGWICFFCYIALSILSPRVHLKERVVVF